MSKFEKLIEYVVNEDMEKARELFHDLCVEKSRTIYENLLDEEELDEADDEDLDEAKDEDLDEAKDEVDESGKPWEKDDKDDVDEAKDEDLDESEEELDEDVYDQFGKAATNESDDEDLDEGMFGEEDDFSGDLAADDQMSDIQGGIEADQNGMGGIGEMEGDEDLEDRVVDLEGALDELEAKFSEIVDGGEYGDEDEEMGMEFGDEEGGMDDEFSMDGEGEDEFDMDSEEAPFEESMVREYKEKVTIPSGSKEVGAGGSVTQNNKSPIAQKREKGSIKLNTGDESGASDIQGVKSFADGMDPRTVGKKVGKGPKANAPTPQKKEKGASSKAILPKSHN